MSTVHCPFPMAGGSREDGQFPSAVTDAGMGNQTWSFKNWDVFLISLGVYWEISIGRFCRKNLERENTFFPYLLDSGTHGNLCEVTDWCGHDAAHSRESSPCRIVCRSHWIHRRLQPSASNSYIQGEGRVLFLEVPHCNVQRAKFSKKVIKHREKKYGLFIRKIK